MLLSSSPMGSDHDSCESGHCQQCANDLVSAPTGGSEEGKANRKDWNASIASLGHPPTRVRSDQSPKSGKF